MKLAPNVKKQPRGIKHKDTEVIIFAGSDAWAHAKQWQEHDARMAGDNEPPVVLADEQLKEIGNLQIVPDGRTSARIFRAGQLDPVMVKAIGQKLAAASIQNANYYPDGMHSQKCENWREYLARERKNIDDGLIIRFPAKKKTEDSAAKFSWHIMAVNWQSMRILTPFTTTTVLYGSRYRIKSYSGLWRRFLLMRKSAIRRTPSNRRSIP